MTMTNADEERFLFEQLTDARQRVEAVKKKQLELQLERNREEKLLDDIEQAVFDYMIGNGIVESENFRIKKTQVVDVLGDFPDEYARIKREPDKRKILANGPEANWYVMKENTHIQLVGEK